MPALPKWARGVARRERSEVTRYAADVLRGKIPSGRWVKMACERHLRDLVDGAERGWRFDRGRAEHVWDFFAEFLCLPDDPGRPFLLLPWEKFILGSLYGWVSIDTGFRRFREAYIEVGKGNGKTPVAAGVGIYGLIGEGERNPEIFSAAPIKDQAARLWDEARKIIDASPALMELIDTHTSSYTANPKHGEGYFKATSGESATKDGPIVHLALIDELHEHKDGDTIRKLRQGFKTRRQPLLFQITNSGSDDTSICWQQREKTCRVLQGKASNDTLFGFIACIDWEDIDGVKGTDDPWRGRRCWPKANPSLGVTIQKEYLQELIDGAANPQDRAMIERLNFGIWTRTATPAFDMHGWDRGQSAWAPADMKGDSCWVGVDMASKLDLASCSALFRIERDDGRIGWRVISRSVTPEKNLEELESRLQIPLSDWAKEGWLIVCPGDQIDPRVIRDQIILWGGEYVIQRLGFDPAYAGSLPQEVAEKCYLGDHQLIQVAQTVRGMTNATKQVQADVRSGLIDAGANPLLRWQISNVNLHVDGNENVKPMKNQTPGGRGKIDAAVAIINGRAVAFADEAEDEESFVGMLDLGL